MQVQVIPCVTSAQTRWEQRISIKLDTFISDVMYRSPAHTRQNFSPYQAKLGFIPGTRSVTSAKTKWEKEMLAVEVCLTNFSSIPMISILIYSRTLITQNIFFLEKFTSELSKSLFRQKHLFFFTMPSLWYFKCFS